MLVVPADFVDQACGCAEHLRDKHQAGEGIHSITSNSPPALRPPQPGGETVNEEADQDKRPWHQHEQVIGIQWDRMT